MASLGIERLPTEPDSDEPAGRSIIDEIRRDYQDAEKAQTLDVAVPGSKLGVRYKALDPGDIPEVDEDDEVVGSDRVLDVLITACDAILVRSKKTDPWTVLESDGLPLRFTQELAELMGWTGLKDARAVMLKVFSKAPSARYAAARHYIEFSAWVAGGRESLLGES